MKNILKYFQGESGSPLMSLIPGTGQMRLDGLLSWDTDDIGTGHEDNNQCQVTGLPSLFTNISAIQQWLESVANIKL